ncbi:MAG TPA: hypothetical protein VFA20_28195 [Myxococcaceae bacterium]|nr:hypothetical protein [Myxococcaceae bacterium]
MTVLLAVGCGPPDQEELSQQDQTLKATPVLFGVSCPASNTCGPEFDRCSEWSAPSGCGSTCTVVQVQTCIDSRGNECTNVAVSRSPTDSCQ